MRYSKRFQYRQGDSYLRSVALKASGGLPYDITGATVWYIVKKNQDDADAAAKLWLYWEDGGDAEGIAVTDPTTGAAQVSRTAAQMITADFDVGIHFWYLKIRTVAGSVYTADSGILEVLPGPTAITPP